MINESGQNQTINATIKGERNKKWDRIKTYAIISAENPYGIQANRVQNKKEMQTLRLLLKDMHLYYVNLIGKYGNKEHSFMIINLSLKDAKYLGKLFKQESFFFAVKEDEVFKVSYYQQYRNDKNEWTGDFKLIETTTDMNIFNEENPEFYSARHNTKFSIPMKVFENLNYKEDLDERIFNDSLDSKRTIKANIFGRLNLITDLDKLELNKIEEEE